MAAKGGSWQRDTTVALGPMSGPLRVSLPGSTSASTRLQADVLHSHVQVSGSLGRIGALNPDLRLQARIDLRDLSALGRRRRRQRPRHRLRKAHRHWANRSPWTRRSRAAQLKISGWPIDRIDAHLVHKGRVRRPHRPHARGGRSSAAVRTAWCVFKAARPNADLKFSGIDVARLRAQGVALGLAAERAPGRDAQRVRRLALDPPGEGHRRDRGRGRGGHGRAGPPRRRPAACVCKAAPSTSPSTSGSTATRPDAGSLPRLRSADLVAKGRARGAWPPPVDATLGGSLGVETEAGPEAVPVTGRARYAGGVYSGNVEARGLGATLTASAEGRGSVLEPAGGAGHVGRARRCCARRRTGSRASTSRHRVRSIACPGRPTSTCRSCSGTTNGWGRSPSASKELLGRGQFTFEAPELRVTRQGHRRSADAAGHADARPDPDRTRRAPGAPGPAHDRA